MHRFYRHDADSATAVNGVPTACLPDRQSHQRLWFKLIDADHVRRDTHW